MNTSRIALAAGLLAWSSPSFAVEVDFEGSYQLRGRYYNSLSLTAAQEGGIPEGNALYAEHRVWMRPRFLLSDSVRMNVDILGLDNVVWGNRPAQPESFVGQPLPDDQLTAPADTSDPLDALRDITLWRAWGEVDFSFGRFSFGRMPLHWGMGIWQNDGLSLNAEYGDTADRLAFETLVQQSIFVRVAFDTHVEGYVNDGDGAFAPSLSGAYRSETITVGLNAHYRRVNAPEGGEPLDLFTIDAAGEAKLGPLKASAEFLARFGSGDYGELNDVNITGFGGVVRAQLDLDRWRFQLEGGYASGDRNLTDARYKTFAFDPDFNVGVILFEQPMPVFATAAPNEANGNRNYDDVLIDNRVANALYAKPTISRRLIDGLDIEAAGLFARAASLPEQFSNRRGYGTEIQVALKYNGLEHLEVDARGAVFIPGSYFRNFSDDVVQGYTRTAVGGQLTARIRF